MSKNLEITVSVRGTMEEVAPLLRQLLTGHVDGDNPRATEEAYDPKLETERLWKEIRSRNARRIIYEIAKHPESEGGITADDLWEAVGVDKRVGPGMLSSAGIAHKRIQSPIHKWIGWIESTRTYMMPDAIAEIYRELAEREELEHYVIGAE